MEFGGFAQPRFQKVAEAFSHHFAEGIEAGAACCIYIDGKVVVDLWGGIAEVASGRTWQADTPVLLASATKGLTAICVHRLVERGVLDLDAPIAEYWPEFAAEGKDSIRVGWLLAHRAGIPAIDRPFTIEDVLQWHPIIAAIAAQKPEWEPGSRHGYHARTFGWIAGELVRRITGVTLGRLFAQEIAAPLQLDCWIGLPAELEAKVAAIVPPDPQVQARIDQYMGADSLYARVMNTPRDLFTYDERWNTRPYHAAEMPSSNGIGTARALSRVYAATIGEIDGVRLLNQATVDAARAERSVGVDAVLGLPTRFGWGFSLSPRLSPHAPEGCFGYAGGGGALGFADPAHSIAFAYTPNRWSMIDFARANALVQALYQSIG